MPSTASTPSPPGRRAGTVRVDGAWLQHQLDLRLVTLTAFAREVPCDTATLRKALGGGRISVRKAADITQALRRLPIADAELLTGLLGATPPEGA